jgi:hypothetical protein
MAVRLYSAGSVLTRDVRIEGFTARDWLRLAEVFRAPDAPPRPPRSGLLAVTSGGALLKLVSTTRGRLDPAQETWPSALESLARRHGATWALRSAFSASEELSDRVAERIEPSMEYLDQLRVMVEVVRELEAEGLIELWPKRAADWKLPSSRVVTRALDQFCGDGFSVLLGVFDRGELFTACAARRMGSGFDHIVGPDELRPKMGLTSGDWLRDYRYLCAATEQYVGPLALGCFAELSTLQRLSTGSPPGSWSKAVLARDVLLSPVSRGVALPLGIDAGRAAFSLAKDFATRFGVQELFDASGPLAPAVNRAQAVIARDLRQWLGFDPWQTLARWFAGGAPADDAAAAGLARSENPGED